MMNLSNRPPFKQIKNTLETVFNKSKQEAHNIIVEVLQSSAGKAAFVALIALTLSNEAMATAPDATEHRLLSDKRMELSNKVDSLSQEISGYETTMIERASKGHPYEVKKVMGDHGNTVTVKSFRLKGIEGLTTGTKVDITYEVKDTSGVEQAVKIEVTKFSNKEGSKEEATVTDGAYDSGINGKANHIRFVNSQGVESANLGFMKDASQDSTGQTSDFYTVIGVDTPIGEMQTLKAYLNAQIAYDALLKESLHIEKPIHLNHQVAGQVAHNQNVKPQENPQNHTVNQYRN